MAIQDFFYPLAGGVLIGISVSVMLYWNGRVTGICGILNGFLGMEAGSLWRAVFLAGLIAGGFLMNFLNPEFFADTVSRDLSMVIASGLLVGFGTVMGSGCTSGHGVCGISRLSIRSIAATCVFILLGMLSVALFRHFVGAP